MENHASDWVAKVVFLIQMLQTFDGRFNLYFWDTRLKIFMLLNFNMLFQLVLTNFAKVNCFCVYKSCSQDQVMQRAYWFP